jgi:proteic killer suppression protein
MKILLDLTILGANPRCQDLIIHRIRIGAQSLKSVIIRKFLTTGSKAGIIPHHSNKLELILQALHTAMSLEDMNISDFRLHPSTGDLARRYAVDVSGNWLFFLSL